MKESTEWCGLKWKKRQRIKRKNGEEKYTRRERSFEEEGGWEGGGESQRKVKPKACLSTGDVLCENREVGGWRRGVAKEVAECGRLERWMAEDGRRRVAGEDVVWQS